MGVRNGCSQIRVKCCLAKRSRGQVIAAETELTMVCLWPCLATLHLGFLPTIAPVGNFFSIPKDRQSLALELCLTLVQLHPLLFSVNNEAFSNCGQGLEVSPCSSSAVDLSDDMASL